MIVYDPHNWYEHLFDIKGSMLRQIVWRVSTSVVWASLILMIHWHVARMDVPLTIYTVLGIALGLLLVFRTNASYDRFWEGRSQWGAIVNESRNLARASRIFLREVPTIHAEVVRWTSAFSYATMNYLRGNTGIGVAAEGLPADEVQEVEAAQNVPLAAAGRISAALAKARADGVISDYIQVYLDQNVQLLMDYLGACERIRKTPLPFAYMVHLRRSLVLYCYTLPFALVETFELATLPVTLFVSYVFFGIEEIGVEIEDPFGIDDNDLPLEQICETIRANVLALIDVQDANDALGVEARHA